MRDDFSSQTLDVLAKRVGVRCSNPFCRKLTTGPRSDASRIVNIGVGAHIAAASPGGPRFDPSMTSSQRGSAENGIWLCQNCAKLVDNDPAHYSITLLLDWKGQAEKTAHAEIEGFTQADAPTQNLIQLKFARKDVDIRSERHDYELHVVLRNLGLEPLIDYHVDLEMPAVVLEGPARLPGYVSGRSDWRKALFRMVACKPDDDVFPGDSRVVLKLPYHMDHDLHWASHRQAIPYELVAEPVRATLFRKGCAPTSIEDVFKSFERF